MSLENMDASAVAELASLAKSLADDPKTRKQFLKLTKEVRPGVILPELEMENTISEQLASRDEKIKNLETTLAERSVLDDLEQKRGVLRKRGADPEEIVEIEKLMVEKGIADHDTAADYFVWKKQAEEANARAAQSATPKQIISPFMDFFSNPFQRALVEAYKALNENRRPARPAGL